MCILFSTKELKKKKRNDNIFRFVVFILLFYFFFVLFSPSFFFVQNSERGADILFAGNSIWKWRIIYTMLGFVFCSLFTYSLHSLMFRFLFPLSARRSMVYFQRLQVRLLFYLFNTCCLVLGTAMPHQNISFFSFFLLFLHFFSFWFLCALVIHHFPLHFKRLADLAIIPSLGSWFILSLFHSLHLTKIRQNANCKYSENVVLCTLCHTVQCTRADRI